MKKHRVLALLSVVLCILMLSGCVVHVSKTGQDASDEDAGNNEATSFGSAGFAVDTEDASYYWQFTSDDFENSAIWGWYEQSENSSVSLVCRKNNGETGTVLTNEGAGTFAVTDRGIFYNNGNGSVIFLDTETQTESETGVNGSIFDVSSDGKYLVVSMYNNNIYSGLYSLDTHDFSTTKIVESGYFLKMHDDIIYYSPSVENRDDASRGKVQLCSSSADGKETLLLCTTAADLYDYETLGSDCSIAQMRFTDEYIYFSYGCVAGTGMFYQGGKIARVKYDGSGFEIVAGNDGNVGSEFILDENGSITDIQYTGGYHEDLSEYFVADGSIFWYDEETGAPINVGSYFADENYYSSDPEFVNVTDRHVYFITHYSENDPENAIGWRESYVRKKSVFYMIDRETGEVVTSYEF